MNTQAAKRQTGGKTDSHGQRFCWGGPLMAIAACGSLAFQVSRQAQAQSIGLTTGPSAAGSISSSVLVPASTDAEGNAAASTQPPTTTSPPKPPHVKRLARWSRALAWTLILLLILIFASAAIVVFSRRFKAFLTGSSPKPTEYVDAWKLHKLPPESESPSENSPDDQPGGPSPP